MPNISFTDLAVQRLSTAGTYYDDNLPAFGLRVGKHRKTWFVIRGKERLRTTIGHYPALSLADARKDAKKLLLIVPQKTDNVRFAEAYDGFKEAKAGKKPRTQQDYKRLIEKYYLPKFATTKLPDITYAAIMAITKGLPPSEKAHCLAVGRTFFRWCVKPPRRYIPFSPLEGVEITLAKKRKRTLDSPELRSVWKAAQQQAYPHGTVVQLLITTGQRKTEIANLRWPWINERDRTITLPDWVTKNSKEHCFPYGAITADILATVPRLNSTDLLFPSRVSNERPVSGWSKYKHELDQLSGVKGHTLHDLRRTMRTLHAEIGTPSNIGERLVNHITGQGTEVELIYDRYKYGKEMKAAVTAYESHLQRLVA